MLKEYLNKIQDSLNQGDAREESYYTHLELLIRQFATENKILKVEITILPKKTEAGNPDFRVWDGSDHITGYIEAKDPSVTNLDLIEESEQLKRYRSTFPNVILTNFYEFRLYREGQLIKKVSVGRQVLAKKLNSAPPVEKEAEFNDLFNTFFSFSLPQVRNAKTLAMELAKRTRFLRDEVISIEIAEEERKGKKAISGFYDAFKKYLIGTLTEQSFADLYSQTITYGLFAARTRSGNIFNRELAFKYIPNTIGILRDIFRFISLEEPPIPLQIIVDDIAEVLNVTDVNKILQDFYREGKGKDPIIHFYETFLSAYDPSIREKRGVYYTPEPVVGYIVRSVHQVLKTHFNIADGLAGENVTLLDPAAGTLTFPAEAIKLAVKEFTDKYGPGGKTKLIRNQILKNFYAFELMMAPYAIGHLKMSFLLEELGYKMGDDERFNLYLTNTLEIEDLEQIRIPGLSSLSEESHLAGIVKKEQNILVILGNPPYSGHSANQNKWTERLLKDNIDGAQSYYEVDGKPLGEKNPKWLQDDYVKFLRFAQWKIHKAGVGIIGMITNHSYLDNPTFRGMRQSLMNTFNEIYILDLHGNNLKKETCPDGTKDENVFDIRQGTAIVLLIKNKTKNRHIIHYNGVFGLREIKYNWLNSNEFVQNNYIKIIPESPYYFFTQRNTEKIRDYLAWKSINEIFPVNSVGIVTARDNLTIRWTENDAWNTVLQFSKMDNDIAREAYKLGKDTRDWKVDFARTDIKQTGPIRENIKPILYRPFDIRYTYYTGNSRGFHCMPRNNVMRHMLRGNIGLTVGRAGQVVGLEHLWNLVFVSGNIIDLNLYYRGGELIFPLYLYKEKAQNKPHFQSIILFEPEAKYDNKDRTPNIDKTIYEILNKTYKKKLAPEELLHYIYAVFYSNTYREKYAEYLKIDFPRVPFTADYKTFFKMAKLGNQLAELHLIKENCRLLELPVSKYNSVVSDKIEKVIYNEAERRIYINSDSYFDNVLPQVWNYYIGGYQVIKKYLDDRRRAGKEVDNSKYITRVISALHHTIIIQSEIDKVYLEVEKKLIEF